MRKFLLTVLIAAFLPVISNLGAEPRTTNYLAEAQTAFRKGRKEEAIALLTEFLKTAPSNAQALFYRAQFRESMNQLPDAIADYDRMVKVDPKAPDVYQMRGWALFKSGEMDKAIADFDRYLGLVPGRAAQHWQRGIAYYYAGRYEDGRKQFELHQTVNPHDVENAVWHFLCVAKLSGLEKARSSLIPITGDARVPMMHVQALFAGKGTVDDVFAAARVPSAKAHENEGQLFYANLYAGLYYEALGKDEQAVKFIRTAVKDYPSDHYMGDVGRVDLLLRERKERK